MLKSTVVSKAGLRKGIFKYQTLDNKAKNAKLKMNKLEGNR